jgi:hypothetical protein
VSRSKGNQAPNWVATFVRPWFPTAAKTPNSRQGRDLENTPGIAFEVKTGAEWRPIKSMAQALGYAADGELPVLVYIPPGMGRAATERGEALFIVPGRLLMPALAEAGYAPNPPPGLDLTGPGFTAQER